MEFLACPGLGAASIVLLGVVGEGARVIQLKTPPQVKRGERQQEKKKKAGIGVTDAVVTQRVNPKVSQVSHTSGTESVLARVVSLWEMLNP